MGNSESELSVSTVPQSDHEGSATQHRVARNAGIYFVLQVVSWAVTFVSISIIPRLLGAKVLGEVVFAGSTVSLVFGLGTFCIDQFLTREVGRAPGLMERLLRATFGLRIAMALPLILATFITLICLHVTPTIYLYSKIGIVTGIFTILAEPLRSALAGRERAFQVSISDLVVTVSALLAIPFLRFGGIVLPICSLIGILTAFYLRCSWLRHEIRLMPVFDISMWKHLIKGGMPFMLSIYVTTFNGYITLLILHHYLNEAAIGQYAQTSRLIGTFLFIPSVLNSALLPALARMAQSDPASLQNAQRRVLVVLIVCALPATVGVILLAHPLCQLLYKAHQFPEMPLALQYAALNLLPLYIVSTIYQFLVAQGRNGRWTIVLAATLAASALLAWLLVPLTMRTMHNGIVGVMVANLLSESMAVVLAFCLLRTNPLTPDVLSLMARGLVATGGMGVVVWMLREGITRLPLVPWLANGLTVLGAATAGVVVFAGLVLALHALPPQEQSLIVDTVKRRLRRA